MKAMILIAGGLAYGVAWIFILDARNARRHKRRSILEKLAWDDVERETWS